MKTVIFKLISALLLLGLMGWGCEKEAKDEVQQEDKQLTVLQVIYNGCKDNLKSSETEQYIKLKAEDMKKLRLSFINATINCSGLDTAYALIHSNTLKVSFLEKTDANCNCDFDLECVIDSMENRSYDVEVYAQGEIPKAKFTFTYSSELDSKIKISNN